MVAQIHNSSSRKVETKESEVQDHRWLHNEFKASVGYVRLPLKQILRIFDFFFILPRLIQKKVGRSNREHKCLLPYIDLKWSPVFLFPTFISFGWLVPRRRRVTLPVAAGYQLRFHLSYSLSHLPDEFLTGLISASEDTGLWDFDQTHSWLTIFPEGWNSRATQKACTQRKMGYTKILLSLTTQLAQSSPEPCMFWFNLLASETLLSDPAFCLSVLLWVTKGDVSHIPSSAGPHPVKSFDSNSLYSQVRSYKATMLSAVQTLINRLNTALVPTNDFWKDPSPFYWSTLAMAAASSSHSFPNASSPV